MKKQKLQCYCIEYKQRSKNRAKSYKEVQDIRKVGAGCGRCVEGNKAVVDYLLKNNTFIEYINSEALEVMTHISES